MDPLREIDDLLKCSITHDRMENPVQLSDGTNYDRTAIRRHLAKQRVYRTPPTSPLTRQPLVPLRNISNYGAEDEDARYYTPNCVLKSICDVLRRHLPVEEGRGEEDLPWVIATQKMMANLKESQAKMNQCLFLATLTLRDSLLSNKAANQPIVPRSELDRLQGVAPPELTPHTVIALRQDYMAPLRECCDGKIFDISMGDLSERLRIISALTENDTQAFLAGDMTFYGAKRRVVAAAPHPVPYKDRQISTLKAKVTHLEKLLGHQKNRINKLYATLRSKKAELGEMEGEASYYEALVETWMDEDDA